MSSEFCVQVPEWLSKLMPREKQLLLHNANVGFFMIRRHFVAICSVSEIIHLM